MAETHRNLETETEAETTEKYSWLSPYDWLNCFLMAPRTTCPGAAPCTVGWTLSY